MPGFSEYQLLLLSLSPDRSARTRERAGDLAIAVADGYIDSMWMIDSTAGGGIVASCTVHPTPAKDGVFRIWRTT
jgi:hypothetical protein